jgi:alkanesulfonate monooxygenase SsuD/methylene tetrahydromethanopterin reductase-like flavin-dependent oxidoreductase (luciferase family)
MVGANTFREPALTAKMATTLDHISAGRAILGIGAAWFETEHRAYGLAFGDGPPERLRWLSEALPVMRDMLRGRPATSAGPRYVSRNVRNDPLPIQPRLPLLVGGGGERVTLKLVARYADANNLGGGPANVKRKEAILLQHCETVGRDPAEIERTAVVGAVTIRNTRAEAVLVADTIHQANGGARPGTTAQIGSPEDVAESLAPYVELGYRHLIADFPAPHDDESMTRFATEVRALLEGG